MYVTLGIVILLFISKISCKGKEKNQFKESNIFNKTLSGHNMMTCHPKDQERIKLIGEYVNTNKNKLSEQDIDLIKFIAGNCLPVIFVPGFYGNKLQLQITNCTAINSYHPEIARACGYDKKCENNFEKIFWLSEDFAKNDGSTCMGELMKLNIIKNETETELSKKFYEMPFKGFRLTYFGNTPKTESENECGFGASSYILDKRFYFGNKSVRGSIELKNHFISLGYKLGVNLFSVPYDWRRHSNDPYNLDSVKQTVDLAYKLTDKKSILIGHSYGSLVALNYLYSLDEKERKIKIDRYVGVGPVFAGLTKGIKTFVLGYEEFNIKIQYIIKILELYLSLENQKILLNKGSASIDMLPKLFWGMHKNEKFMWAIRNRTNVENEITECVRNYYKDNKKRIKFLEETDEFSQTNIDFDSSQEDDKYLLNNCIDPISERYSNELMSFKNQFPFYPSLEKGCNERKFVMTTCLKTSECKPSIWDEYCRLNLINPLDFFALNVTDKNQTFHYDLISKENIFKMIEDFAIRVVDLEYFKYVYESIKPEMHYLNHPKIPVTVYYTTQYKTSLGFSIPENPRNITDKNLYVTSVFGAEEITYYGGGDGTVPSSTFLIPTLKWTTQVTSEKDAVHMYEYCSNDDRAKEQSIDIGKNQYFGLKCRCKEPAADGCTHSSMVGDENILNSITKYVVNEKNIFLVEELTKKIDLVGKKINHIETGFICSNLRTLEELYKDKFYQ